MTPHTAKITGSMEMRGILATHRSSILGYTTHLHQGKKTRRLLLELAALGLELLGLDCKLLGKRIGGIEPHQNYLKGLGQGERKGL